MNWLCYILGFASLETLNMAMLVFRRFVVVLWVVALLVSIYSMFTAFTSGIEASEIVGVAVMCLIIFSIPMTLSYLFFGIFNPFKLWQYT